MKLGYPVQLLQRLTSSKEFTRWKVFLLQEVNEFKPEFYYWASIAAIIAKVNSKDPEKITLEDFLLKFEVRGKEDSKSGVSEEQAKINKKLFLASMGVGLDDIPTQRPPKPKTPFKQRQRKTPKKASK